MRNLVAPLLLLTTMLHAQSATGIVLDRAGVPLEGVSLRSVGAGSAVSTTSDGRWSIQAQTTSISARTDWTAAWFLGGLRVTLPTGGSVRLEWRDLRGRRVGPAQEFQLGGGSHVLLSPGRGRAMEWATFQLDGEDAIVLGPGADGRTGGALVRRDGFRSSASADTLLVEKSGHPPIRIPLARVRRDSVVVRIDTSSRSTWNDTVSRLEALYDERDGQVYRTFRLGRQRWLSENLNHATPGSWWYKGDLWASTGTTWLDDSSKSGTKFGRFYTWAQAMGLPDSCDRAWCHAPASQEGIGLIAGPTRQGVCPNGWHVPADSEWIEMLEALTREYSLASPNPPGIRQSEAMRARNSWTHSSWEYPVAATDRAGFRALPSGSRAPTGSFSAGAGAGWWVSNEYNAASCVFRYTSKDDLKRYVDRKTEGRSLRCVED